MTNSIKNYFNSHKNQLTFEEKWIYGGSIIFPSAASALFVGRQIHQHKAKLTPLLHNNRIWQLPFGVGLGIAYCSSHFLTKHLVQIPAKEKLNSIKQQIQQEDHYRNIEKMPFLVRCILAPITEEVIFRGAIQPTLVRLIGKHPGILATSLLFGLAHTLTVEESPTASKFEKESGQIKFSHDFSASVQLLNGCIHGLFTGYLRHHFGFMSSIGCHIANNSIVYLAYRQTNENPIVV